MFWPKFILTLLFVLTLAAGLATGMLVSRLPLGRPAHNSPQTALAAQLGLTPEQNERMHDIWQEVRNKVDACFLRAQEVQKRRDDLLLQLLTDEQKVRFAPAQKEYNDSLASLRTERDAMFQDAVRRTEQILNESQKERYRQIVNSRLGDEAINNAPDWMSQPAPPTSRPAAKG